MARATLYRCPQCNAAETQAIEETSDRECSYCGARFSVEEAQEAERAAHPIAMTPMTVKLIVGGIATLVVLGFVLALSNHKKTVIEVQAPRSQKRRPTPSAVAPPPKVTRVGGSSLGEAPAERPVPEPLTATFEFHSAKKNSIGALWIYGFVTNSSKLRIAGPEILVVLEDANDEELRTAHGFGPFELEAGERGPVKLMVEDAPAFDHMDFEVHPRAQAGQAAQGLVLEDPKKRPGKYGKISLTGKVKNTGETPVRFGQVFVLQYDSKDKLTGLDTGYLKSDSLAPGNEARYLIDLHVAPGEEAPARLEYLVRGKIDKR